jgi:RHS repeat-associated protein
MNEHGQITTYGYGNGLNLENKYDGNGLPEQFHTLGSNVFNMSFDFDPITGNLDSRTHVVGSSSQTESFTYDGYDRLETINQTGNTQLLMEYHDNGNIFKKPDVGTYHYDSLPHVPSSINPLVADVLLFTPQKITYTPFDKTDSIIEGEHELTFYYAHDAFRTRAELKKLDGSEFLLEKTTYYATGYEETHAADGSIQKRHYINTPTGLAAIYTEDGNDSGALHYIHQDYQGSIMAISAEDGTVEQSLSYDAWGRRRNPTSWNSYDLTGHEPMFDRGYTGHEHLEEFGLINMNGRMYDPLLGQMLSPDNYVQDATNGQNYNRYAYVLNNPLKYTDPSGEFLLLFTDLGYDLQKYVSPFAVKLNINYNSQGLSVGVDASIGMPQILPVHARAQVGVSYHFGNDYNSYKGWEGRYGFEAGVGLGTFSFKSAMTYSDFEGSKFDQRTNQITLGGPLINFKYENDFMFGLPADGGDRYRSAAGRLNIGLFNVGFNLYTGDPGLRDDDRKPEYVDGQLTYVKNANGDDPDEFRSGVLYFGFGGFRIGRNSETVRHRIQNEFAHDTAYGWTSGGDKLPHFAIDKSKKPEWYWNFGTGTGNSLW